MSCSKKFLKISEIPKSLDFYPWRFSRTVKNPWLQGLISAIETIYDWMIDDYVELFTCFHQILMTSRTSYSYLSLTIITHTLCSNSTAETLPNNSFLSISMILIIVDHHNEALNYSFWQYRVALNKSDR